jgi:hypothetical protein
MNKNSVSLDLDIKKLNMINMMNMMNLLNINIHDYIYETKTKNKMKKSYCQLK